MIGIQIDYQNMQFIIYQHNKPVKNPLPVEVQRTVILQVIEHCSEIISCLLEEQLDTDPDGVRQALVH